MTIMIPALDFQKLKNDNQNNQDSFSTSNMIYPENINAFNKLSNVKILSATLIIITTLIGLFLLGTIYMQTTSRCVCEYGSVAKVMQESQNAPYFEPLKALTSSETSKEIRNLPLKIQMHGDARNIVNGNINSGRISCEVTRKMSSQVIASEPHEVQTPFGNLTTDPKLLHLTGEKLFFTCYNGEKPKPVYLVSRPKVFAIFHQLSNSNSSESDENLVNLSETDSNSKEDNFKSNESVKNEENKEATSKNSKDSLVRNRRQVSKKAFKESMECSCSCPIKKQ